MQIIDDGKRSEIKFKNGDYLSVIYKSMTDKNMFLHYQIGRIGGTMKLKPVWEPRYDDIIGMAECGMPELFFPLLFKHIYDQNKKRLDNCIEIVRLWDRGWRKKAQEKNGYYSILTEASIRDKKKFIVSQTEFMERMDANKLEVPEPVPTID